MIFIACFNTINNPENRLINFIMWVSVFLISYDERYSLTIKFQKISIIQLSLFKEKHK